MKKQKIVSLLIIISLFFIISSVALAEKRNIYVGDLIQIRVTTQEFTGEELRDKFKDFEIVNMEEKEDGCLLTLRSFEPGEKKIQLGDKEIVIDVKSTLKEIKRVGIYEGDPSPEKAGMSLYLQYVFYVLLAVFLVTGGINLWRFMKKRKKSSKTPFQHFMARMNAVSEDDDGYFVKLTFYFKEYIESRYSCRIRGKTSSEIIDEIKSLHILGPKLPAIQAWLEKSDRFKFSGIQASRESKQELHQELEELVIKINEIKEGEL